MPRHATSTSFGAIRGNKPKPSGVGGRYPDMMRDRLKLILERRKTLESIEKVLDDPNNRHFAKVLDTALDRVEGKVPQQMDLTSGGKSVQGVVVLPQQEQVGATPIPQQLPAETD